MDSRLLTADKKGQNWCCKSLATDDFEAAEPQAADIAALINVAKSRLDLCFAWSFWLPAPASVGNLVTRVSHLYYKSIKNQLVNGSMPAIWPWVFLDHGTATTFL